MPDILIRDVPEDDLAAIDGHAARARLSRSEYLRRRLAQFADESDDGAASLEDLRQMHEALADGRDPAIMRGAWH